MTTGAGSGKTPAQLVLAGIDRREALARAALTRLTWVSADEAWDECGPMGLQEWGVQVRTHQDLAFLAAAREELTDAVAQQERHVGIEGPDSYCDRCEAHWMPCHDRLQAERTLARLTRLYA